MWFLGRACLICLIGTVIWATDSPRYKFKATFYVQYRLNDIKRSRTPPMLRLEISFLIHSCPICTLCEWNDDWGTWKGAMTISASPPKSIDHLTYRRFYCLFYCKSNLSIIDVNVYSLWWSIITPMLVYANYALIWFHLIWCVNLIPVLIFLKC